MALFAYAEQFPARHTENKSYAIVKHCATRTRACAVAHAGQWGDCARGVKVPKERRVTQVQRRVCSEVAEGDGC